MPGSGRKGRVVLYLVRLLGVTVTHWHPLCATKRLAMNICRALTKIEIPSEQEPLSQWCVGCLSPHATASVLSHDLLRLLGVMAEARYSTLQEQLFISQTQVLQCIVSVVYRLPQSASNERPCVYMTCRVLSACVSCMILFKMEAFYKFNESCSYHSSLSYWCVGCLSPLAMNVRAFT